MLSQRFLKEAELEMSLGSWTEFQQIGIRVRSILVRKGEQQKSYLHKDINIIHYRNRVHKVTKYE